MTPWARRRRERLAWAASRRRRAHRRADGDTFESLASTAPDAIITADAWGQIRFFNAHAEIMFGRRAEEVLGRPLTVLMPERFRAAHLAGLARFVNSGQGSIIGRTVELAACRADGTEFPIEMSLSSTGHGADRTVTGIIRDVTERHQSAAAAARHAEELEAANAQLDAFTRSVSHDLQSPLRGILGFARILLDDYGEAVGAEGRAHIARIRRQASRMEALIGDLLSFSRASRSPLASRQVDLSAIARDIAEDLAARDPSRAVDVRIADHLAASGDPGLLSIVLQNLLGNAWKYTRGIADPRIEVGERAGAPPEFFIRDNGAGFAMEHAARLFTPFVRLHSPEEFEGTGLGLATVRAIVRRHGGEVRAHSAPLAGTTISFTLAGAA